MVKALFLFLLAVAVLNVCHVSAHHDSFVEACSMCATQPGLSYDKCAAGCCHYGSQGYCWAPEDDLPPTETGFAMCGSSATTAATAASQNGFNSITDCPVPTATGYQ
mmetsp:Transcript_8338/g.9700  ORF Transcript_8338/g.9700 Transcript_8338/m.9700 type:complete len:107 (+) Transcript_8338:149-469(+)